MALSVLKKTPIHCVVKVTGAGATTITLATDLLHSHQTAVDPTVNIAAIHFAVPGATPATVVRNSITHYELAGNYSFDFNGFSDSDDNKKDIIVTLPAGGGTVILELTKIGGYGDVQHRGNDGGAG